MPGCAREVCFLDAARGGRFCLLTRPLGAVKGGVVFVHPFAEELNKTRRMTALAVRQFAEYGWVVLQMDLYGCGDSAGDFGDATWQQWVDDVDLGYRHLLGACPELGAGAPIVLWTLRSGSLLLADWLRPSERRPPLLLWQPVTSGKQHLTQFLRLKAANEMLSDADARTVMARIRAELQRGEAVEVAGYTVSAELVRGMDASSLILPPGFDSPVAIFESSRMEAPTLSPAVELLVGKWREAGVSVTAGAVSGPGFWQTQEIETAPALIEPSLRFLQHLSP